MGVFDYITCEAGDRNPKTEYQTESFEWPYLDRYEIRKDGTLWREEYDIEDRSDPNAEGLDALAGSRTRVNKRWMQMENFTGEVRFGDGKNGYSAYFVHGALKHLGQL